MFNPFYGVRLSDGVTLIIKGYSQKGGV
jgi:hypothetical protein